KAGRHPGGGRALRDAGRCDAEPGDDRGLRRGNGDVGERSGVPGHAFGDEPRRAGGDPRDPAERDFDRLEPGHLQGPGAQGRVRPRDVRDLVQDGGHAPERSGRGPGGDPPLPGGAVRRGVRGDALRPERQGHPRLDRLTTVGERAVRPRLIFSTSGDRVLAERLAALGAGTPGTIERETFPDGERGLRVASPVADADAILVGGTGSDAGTLELYDLACALVECGLHALTLVGPYFGYSTQERPSKDGDSVTAKTRARLLSSIPLPSGGLRILLVDLHTAGLPYYFEGGVRPVHVTARPLFAAAIRALAPEGCVVASTDAGRAKYVEALANDLGVDASFVFKRRDAGRARVLAVGGRRAGRHGM